MGNSSPSSISPALNSGEEGDNVETDDEMISPYDEFLNTDGAKNNVPESYFQNLD